MINHKLPFHDVHSVNEHILKIPVYQNYNSQPNGGLGGRYDNYEHGEDLAGEFLGSDEFGKGDEINIDCIKHQLNTHQNSDRIAAGQNAVQSNPEKDCGQ